MFNLLSSGEKCIYHWDKRRKYRYYDPLNRDKNKNQDELELEFRNQVRCFQACFIDDCEHGGFRYPDNLNKNKIMEDVKKWMSFAKKGKRNVLYKTYEKFLKLLEGEKIVVDKVKLNYDKNQNTIQNGLFSGIDKNEVKNYISAGMISSKAAFALEDEFKKDYENGDYSIKAKLYKDPPKEKVFWRNFGEKIGILNKDDENNIEDY